MMTVEVFTVSMPIKSVMQSFSMAEPGGAHCTSVPMSIN